MIGGGRCGAVVYHHDLEPIDGQGLAGQVAQQKGEGGAAVVGGDDHAEGEVGGGHASVFLFLSPAAPCLPPGRDGAGRHADRHVVGGDVGQHHSVGADAGAGADANGPKNARSGAHPDVVLEGGIAVFFGLAEGVVAEKTHPAANFAVAANDDAQRMHKPDAVAQADVLAQLDAVQAGLYHPQQVVEAKDMPPARRHAQALQGRHLVGVVGQRHLEAARDGRTTGGHLGEPAGVED